MQVQALRPYENKKLKNHTNLKDFSRADSGSGIGLGTMTEAAQGTALVLSTYSLPGTVLSTSTWSS